VISGAPSSPAGIVRYDRVAARLHWGIGLALLGQLAFGFLLGEIAPRGTPARAGVINLHKSIGLVLGALIVVRIGWRLVHRPPPWPGSMTARQQGAARWGHVALYTCMAVLPIAGYVGSNFSRHGIRFFGLALAPWGPDWPAASALLVGIHVTAALVFTALIAGHVAMAFRHAAFDRDGSFARIVP
jgi:cytochrome b561